MFLAPYFSEKDGLIAVSAPQASHFAKAIAGDFNPIHDEDARKFCVPGDLMFALVVQRLGVHQHMDFRFLGTVGAGVGMTIPQVAQPEFEIINDKGKAVVSVQLSGSHNGSGEFAEQLIREYVAFSGQNFPHILVPLLAQRGMMINPARPLVMYESMSLQFDRLDIDRVALRLAGAALEVDGKRGDAALHFDILSGDDVVGRGAKQLALGGLLPYDQGVMDQVIAEYEAWKVRYQSGYEAKAIGG